MRELTVLVQELRDQYPNLENQSIADADLALGSMHYSYNDHLFPRLEETDGLFHRHCDTPANLAEALLWKMGKWQVYQTFCRNFRSADDEYVDGGIVFYAFARHLRNNEYPIFDQHSLRALWAIAAVPHTQAWQNCYNSLMTRAGDWTDYRADSAFLGAYQWYCDELSVLRERHNVDLYELDRVLMPLGQAIKKHAKGYSELASICGW